MKYCTALPRGMFFSASVDTENFYKTYSEIQKVFGNLVSDEMKKLFGNSVSLEGTNCHPQPPQYSSVMDYMDFHNPVLFVPGKLDIAALRFIYFDKVDLKKEGSVLEIPSGADRDPNNLQKSILQTADDKEYLKEEIKSYKVLCGGEKIEGRSYREIDPNQPLCKKFDYGANPLEIAINSILKTNSSLLNRRNRYDSERTSFYKNLYFVEQAGALYKKWKQYRDELLNQKGKSIEDYSFLNPKHISEYQQVIKEEQVKSLDFKMYYDIRKPVFDYFKRLVFMPVKHCIYKQKSPLQSPPQYSAVALENILTEETGDYVIHPDNSGERFINCKSSVAEDWAKKNKKGKLVTEVGFLSETKRYFLRPKDKYPIDEISAFTILDEIVANNSPFFDIAIDPEFGDEYYHEIKVYALQGANLNPYINETVMKDPEIPRDSASQIQLNRILSYKADERILKNELVEGIFRRRLLILEAAINKLKSQEKSKEMELQLEWKPRTLIDIGNTAESIENNGDYPFFTQAYEDYNSRKKEPQTELDRHILDNLFDDESKNMSFASFIKHHPATLYNRANSSFVLIPYIDTDENLPARLFRRFNEFVDCIENQKKENIACDDIEEKEVFIKTILNHYYLEVLNKQKKGSSDNAVHDRLGRERYFEFKEGMAQ